MALIQKNLHLENSVLEMEIGKNGPGILGVKQSGICMKELWVKKYFFSIGE